MCQRYEPFTYFEKEREVRNVLITKFCLARLTGALLSCNAPGVTQFCGAVQPGAEKIDPAPLQLQGRNRDVFLLNDTRMVGFNKPFTR